MAYILFFIYLILSLVIQLLTGDFPAMSFSFPFNLILFLVWITTAILLWKKGRKSGFIRFMLSPGATFLAVGLFFVFSLVVGITGFRWLTGTWPFVAFLLYFQTVLIFVILRGWRRPTAKGARLGAIRWRFLMLHFGLLLGLGSSFWGAPDTETAMVRVYKGETVSEAYSLEGRPMLLKHSVRLDDFYVSYGTGGIPSDYKAMMTVGGELVELRVNHPHSISFGKDLYLSGYDTDAGEYCVLQIVHEPWRYGTIGGIMMMIAGAFLLFIGGPDTRNRLME